MLGHSLRYQSSLLLALLLGTATGAGLLTADIRPSRAQDPPSPTQTPAPPRVVPDVVTLNHDSCVCSIAFSPNSTMVATGAMDYLIRLWDPATGYERMRLRGHEGCITSLAFSPDGNTLASGSKDQTIRLWDLRLNKELRSIRQPDGVYSVAFSPDGRTLATAGRDGTIRIWDPASGNRLRQMTLEDPSVRPPAFRTTVRAPSMTVWEQTPPPANWVKSVAFSPDGKRLASGSTDRTVRIWNPATGQELRRLTGHLDRVDTVAFSADGNRLASGSRDKTIRVWDAATGREIRTLVDDKGAWVHGVAFLPEGRMLASADTAGTARLWDLDTGRVVHRFSRGQDQFEAMALSPNGRQLAAGGVDGKVSIWPINEELRTARR